ncbi:MAG TPA: precorrin-8X methylmutase [Candidatus Aquicultor sp.]|jgi:precorrin-8X/cobalt-precorrin-8 methylmutase
MSTGFIVLGHGSKVPETVETLKDITNSLKRRLRLDQVRYAALQFNTPTLPDAIESLISGGINDIVILPFFLIEGNHMRQDIPEIISDEKRKHPSVSITLAEHIGADDRIVEILADRAHIKASDSMKNQEDANDEGGANSAPGACNITGDGSKKLQEPRQIEEESFRIIEGLVDLRALSEVERAVVTRMIHASGDVQLLSAIDISDGAIDAGVRAIREPCAIITDVQMAATGISTALAKVYNNEVLCKVNDPEVITEAETLKKTRSAVGIRSRANHIANGIVVIGNAPTALFELLSMVQEGFEKPALVIGTPVGFVGAAESKEALRASGLPYITVRGTRGGSALAVAAANAVLKLATQRITPM